MPVTPTYPGVYIEEIPSGVRTITGVATSITAFIGRAKRGPVNEAVPIFNYGDFERTFGGLGVDYPMSYTVRDFFLNGGAQAIIVRLYAPSIQGEGDAAEEVEGRAVLEFTGSTGFKFKAISPGMWGNWLRVEIDQENIAEDIAARFGLVKPDLFNLTVMDTATDTREKYVNLTLKQSPRRIDRVLADSSNLIVWSGDNLDGTTIPGLPTVKVDKILEKERGLTQAKKALRDAKLSGKPDTTAEEQAVTDAEAALKSAKDNATQGMNGEPLTPLHYAGSLDDKTGLFALEKTDLFNLLCIPPDTRLGDTHPLVYQTALSYCNKRRAMLIVDPLAGWSANKETAASDAKSGLGDLGLSTIEARNAALYFPRVIQADPLRDGQLDAFVPCGIMAGIMSRTDVRRGVWKAPAGIDDGGINGIQGLQVNLTDDENGLLNPLGINCLRVFPIIGRVAWGARTLRGADQLADEYKYIPVRRLALFIEESLYRGLQWVVFEPNDEPLWAQIRLNVGAFMQNLFRQGAFQGTSPRDAYFVKCDKETTTQNDINLGIVNIHVGFAPLKPAEFVIIKLQQIAGQVEV